MQFKFTVLVYQRYEDSVLWLFLGKYLICGKPQEDDSENASRQKRAPDERKRRKV